MLDYLQLQNRVSTWLGSRILCGRGIPIWVVEHDEQVLLCFLVIEEGAAWNLIIADLGLNYVFGVLQKRAGLNLAIKRPNCDTLDKAIVVYGLRTEEVQVNWVASFYAQFIAGRSEVGWQWFIELPFSYQAKMGKAATLDLKSEQERALP